MALRDAASKQQQKKTTCISSMVQTLGYDRLPKRTGRAAIADRGGFSSVKLRPWSAWFVTTASLTPLMGFLVPGLLLYSRWDATFENRIIMSACMRHVLTVG